MFPVLFDPMYLVFIAPAFILSMVAQAMISSRYAKAKQAPAQFSGYAAARRMLDAEGLQAVGIEQVPGRLSDHYDPRQKVLRLSPDVYHGHSLAAVGIAAHEAGHALQDAQGYVPLVVRNAAVPIAGFGSSAGLLLVMLGLVIGWAGLMFLGIILFSAVVFFQVVNLPVEFNASARAKARLVDLGIVRAQEMGLVNKVLNAAALTYVAATLQSILILLYYVMRYLGSRD